MPPVSALGLGCVYPIDMEEVVNVLDAAYYTGRDYAGGADALGQRVGRPNLSDELNPNRRSAKLGLQTAVDMQALSGDYRILYAMAAQLRHYPPLPMPEHAPGEPCLQTLAAVAERFGVLMQELVTDLSDSKITDNELSTLRRRWGELVAEGQQLMQQLAAMNAALREKAPGQQTGGAA